MGSTERQLICQEGNHGRGRGSRTGNPACVLEQRFSHFREHQSHPEDLLQWVLLHPTPRVSDSIGLGWGLIIGISNQFQGEVGAGVLGTRL